MSTNPPLLFGTCDSHNGVHAWSYVEGDPCYGWTEAEAPSVAGADDLIRAAATALLHGEDWDVEFLKTLADALGVDHADVEAIPAPEEPPTPDARITTVASVITDFWPHRMSFDAARQIDRLYLRWFDQS